MRDIQISWNAVETADKYEVWKKPLNPDVEDWVKVVDIVPPITNYTYAGVDEWEYIFKIKAFKADKAIGEDQLIEFPKRVSGFWETPMNTPDNQPMVVPYDIPYMTKEEFIKHPIARGLRLSASSPEYNDGTIDELLLCASSEVNRYCRRYFQKMTIDEIYPNVTIQVANPRLTTVPLKYPPVQKINTIYIQVLKWFIKFELTYLIQHPQQRFYQIVPLISCAGTTGAPIPSVLLEQSQLGIIWTNYTFGYDIIPEEIKCAVALIAGKFWGTAKQNPLGLNNLRTGNLTLGWGEYNPINEEVKRMLDPYKLITIRMT